ncbi:hypothetical protein P5B29_002622, partial [Enterococcus faecium]|nr:hypothetical protein [Enterococcus faecium]
QEREISYKLNGVGTYNAITANVKQLVNFTYTGEAKQEVNIPDAALKAAINAELNSEKIDGKTDRAATDPVYDLELAQMIKLTANRKNIADLTGLEKATNLQELRLDYNKISNVMSLRDLSQLTVLSIGGMKSLTDDSNLSSLKNLTNLTYFSVGEDNVTDISVVKNFTKLKTLYINQNHISDFRPLKDIISQLTIFSGKNQTLTAEKQEVTGNQAVVKPMEMILPNGTKLFHAAEISDNGQFHMDNIVIPWDSDQEKNVTYRLASGGAGTMASISATVTQPVKFTHTTESLVITPYKLAEETI